MFYAIKIIFEFLFIIKINYKNSNLLYSKMRNTEQLHLVIWELLNQINTLMNL